MNKLKPWMKYLFLFYMGGSIYYYIEVMFRGYSYLSMFVLGGICFIYCGLQNEKTAWDYPFWKQLAKSELFVLIAEFITGCILNLWFGLGIWDYSNLPGNILGQTSWQFALLFLPVCAFGIIFDDYLRYWFFNEEEPHYNFHLR